MAKFSLFNKSTLTALMTVALLGVFLSGCAREEEKPTSSVNAAAPANESEESTESKSTAKEPSAIAPSEMAQSAKESADQVQNSAVSKMPTNNLKEVSMSMEGTVVFMSFEGGFYGIITKSGQKFLPMNLSGQYRQDGLKIQFSGTVVKDMMTIQQWGTPFRIQQLKVIGKGKGGGDNLT